MNNNAQANPSNGKRGASAGEADEDSIQWLDTDDKGTPAEDSDDDDSVQCLGDTPANKESRSSLDAPAAKGWGAIQDAPAAKGWGANRDVPAAKGWGSTQDVPAAKGWGATRDVPATKGWGPTQNAPAAKDWESIQDVPATKGWGATQDVPAAKGWGATQDVPAARGWGSIRDMDEPASVEGEKRLRRDSGEEDEMDLIDLDWEPTDQLVEIDDDESSCVIVEEPVSAELQVIDERHRETHKPDYSRLPIKAICYDYSTQPIEVTEIPRKFYPELNHATPPFRRPIIVDGIGFIYSFIRCSASQPYKFPLAAILRCLFYWISRGHATTLAFPRSCNPIDDESFQASDAQKAVLRKLARNELVLFFDLPAGTASGHEWYKQRMDQSHACVVVSVNHWTSDTMSLFDQTKADSAGASRHPLSDLRLLQPFMINDGLIVFFSSVSSSGRHVSQMVVIKEVQSWDHYEQFDKLQLGFIDQAKQLKILHEHLPADLRFRETAVMVEIIKRLAPFLPGGGGANQ